MVERLRVCKKCHETKDTGAFPKGRACCRQCENERGRQWRAANPEKQHACDASWRTRHADALRAKKKSWYAENQQHLLARRRTYYAEHIDAERARNLAWNTANPDKRREFRDSRRKRIQSVFVERVRLPVLVERDRGRCGICGTPVVRREMSVDHILPLSKGGEHSYANTRLTHLRCNISRSNSGAAQLRMLS